MNLSDQQAPPSVNRKQVWTGRVISGLLVLAFGMSGLMKLKGGPEFAEGSAKLGLPESMRIPLAVLELACVAIYLIPSTTVIGAILLTGYMGGAICTHWRVGDPFPVHIVIGVLIWLGVCFREPRLWAVMPWRKR